MDGADGFLFQVLLENGAHIFLLYFLDDQL